MGRDTAAAGICPRRRASVADAGRVPPPSAVLTRAGAPRVHSPAAAIRPFHSKQRSEVGNLGEDQETPVVVTADELEAAAAVGGWRAHVRAAGAHREPRHLTRYRRKHRVHPRGVGPAGRVRRASEFHGPATEERVSERVHSAGASRGIVDELRVRRDARGGRVGEAPSRRGWGVAPSSLFERVSEVEDVGEDAAAAEVATARASRGGAAFGSAGAHEPADVTRPQNRAAALPHDQLAEPVVADPQLHHRRGTSNLTSVLRVDLLRDVADETLELFREPRAILEAGFVVHTVVVVAAEVHDVALLLAGHPAVRVAVQRDDLARSPSAGRRAAAAVGAVLVEGREEHVEPVVLVVDVPPVVAAGFIVVVLVLAVDVLDVDLGALLLVVLILVLVFVFVLGVLVGSLHLVVVVVAVVVPVVDGGGVLLLLFIPVALDHGNLLLLVVVHEVDVRLAVGVLIGVLVGPGLLLAGLVLVARFLLARFVLLVVAVAVHRLEHLPGDPLELGHLLRVVLGSHGGGTRETSRAPGLTLGALPAGTRALSRGRGRGGGLTGVARALREPRLNLALGLAVLVRLELNRSGHHLERAKDGVDQHGRRAVVEIHAVQRGAHRR